MRGTFGLRIYIRGMIKQKVFSVLLNLAGVVRNSPILYRSESNCIGNVLKILVVVTAAKDHNHAAPTAFDKNYARRSGDRHISRRRYFLYAAVH